MRQGFTRTMREMAAIVAVWALVLHGLAMGFAPVAHHGAAAAPGILCIAGEPGAAIHADGGGHGPDQAAERPFCCILCAGQALAAPADGGQPPPPRTPMLRIAAAPPADDPLVARPERRPVAPRAPPILA